MMYCGTRLDKTGGVIPGAVVGVTEIATGIVRETSGQRGRAIQVEMDGFDGMNRPSSCRFRQPERLRMCRRYGTAVESALRYKRFNGISRQQQP